MTCSGSGLGLGVRVRGRVRAGVEVRVRVRVRRSCPPAGTTRRSCPPWCTECPSGHSARSPCPYPWAPVRPWAPGGWIRLGRLGRLRRASRLRRGGRLGCARCAHHSALEVDDDGLVLGAREELVRVRVRVGLGLGSGLGPHNLGRAHAERGGVTRWRSVCAVPAGAGLGLGFGLGLCLQELELVGREHAGGAVAQRVAADA
eukprot:scaffold27704_cov46-Phaeocystis_antarctica.AAC.1